MSENIPTNWLSPFQSETGANAGFITRLSEALIHDLDRCGCKIDIRRYMLLSFGPYNISCHDGLCTLSAELVGPDNFSEPVAFAWPGQMNDCVSDPQKASQARWTVPPKGSAANNLKIQLLAKVGEKEIPIIISAQSWPEAFLYINFSPFNKEDEEKLASLIISAINDYCEENDISFVMHPTFVTIVREDWLAQIYVDMKNEAQDPAKLANHLINRLQEFDPTIVKVTDQNPG